MACGQTLSGNDMSKHTGRTRRERRGGHSLLSILFLVLAALGVTTATASVASANDDVPLVKVFVVPQTAQPPTLASVAASTLGDPARSSEIFELNQGLAQPDGGSLNAPSDALRPGWILRLPEDADGPDVQLAQDNSGSGNAQEEPQIPADRGPEATDPAEADGLSLPLAAVVATGVAVLLALVTVGIVARRQVRRGVRALGRMLHRLGDPVRHRRRLAARHALASRFAGDQEGVRRAYGALEELTAPDGASAPAVHALRVDKEGLTAWLAAPDRAPDPWHEEDGGRWRRPAGANIRPSRGAGGAALRPDPAACLVRVGVEDDGAPVFVDLSRLDGVLSVTGDLGVAREVVQGLLAEVALGGPVPVTLLSPDGASRFVVPDGLMRQPPPAVSAVTAGNVAAGATLRAAAARRPLRGLVVLAGPPNARDADDLAALCGPGGAGWTGLVCGDVAGAHWRWDAAADGRVTIPVLGVNVTAPA